MKDGISVVIDLILLLLQTVRNNPGSLIVMTARLQDTRSIYGFVVAPTQFYGQG
jgi:hypothetical protein